MIRRSSARPIGEVITIAAILVLGFLATNASTADEPATAPGKTISISGAVQTPLAIKEADLRALPPTVVSISFMTGRGEEHGMFKGALLWSLLNKAVVADGPEKGAHLRHTIFVAGHDGYVVALSIGEIDPRFEGKQVIVAYEKDGQPLAGGEDPRLIIPGDRHGGRAVRDIVTIDVQ